MAKFVSNSGEYIARTYVQGDEIALVSLFNIEHKNLAGFVPRTVEYWRWCCLDRPDVDEKGILILEKGNAIVGYAVVGKSGNIWEFCYDSSRDAKTIVSKLLAWSVNYSRNVGSNSVALNAYIKDSLMREVCRDMDFSESPSEPVFMSVLDLPKLMCEILQERDKNLYFANVLWFDLKNCPPWCVSSFGLRFAENRVEVLEEPVSASRTTIVTEMSTLVSLIFGKEHLLRSLATLKICFHPFWRILEVKKLLSLLQIKTPWFLPRADIA